MKIDTGLAHRMVEEALRLGAQASEVYMRFRKGASAEARGGALESAKSVLDFGYSVRVIREGRMGFSYSTDAGAAMESVRAALEASKHAERDEFLFLPGKADHAACPEIFDPETERMTTGGALQKALEIEEGALGADRRIKRVRSAIASFGTEEIFIANSNGVAGRYVSTSASAQVMAVAEEAGDSQMGWDFAGSCFLSEVSFREVGRRAAGKALTLLGAGKTVPRKASVLLDNAVAAEFLGVFASMLSAEAAQKGKSLLAGRVGQEVINGNIDIIDDGLMPRGMGTRPFDDEGVPAVRKTLIERGVLRGFMHNARTAKKEGAASTGNAVRAGLGGPPGVGPLNLYLAPSDGKASKFEELFAMAGEGLYVVEAMGMHTANPISGEFSIGVSGLLIEGGKTGRPVKEAVISGHLLAFFGKVRGVGDDLRFFGSTGSPGVLMEGVDISA